MKQAAGLTAVTQAGYDTLARPRMLRWAGSNDLSSPGPCITSKEPTPRPASTQNCKTGT